MAGKKQAKMGHSKIKTAAPQDTSASKLVMVTGVGCRVSESAQFKADCGRPRVGWRYGTDDNVTCPNCLEGSQFDDIPVPPGQFEVEEVLKELNVASSLD